MLSPSDRNTNRIARFVIRTHAVPIVASANGSTTSTTAISAMPPHTAFGLPFRSASMFIRLPSCAIPDALAEQAARPEHEHRDQHQEGEDVLVVAAEYAAGEIADRAGAERLDQAEQHAAQHRAAEI